MRRGNGKSAGVVPDRARRSVGRAQRQLAEGGGRARRRHDEAGRRLSGGPCLAIAAALLLASRAPAQSVHVTYDGAAGDAAGIALAGVGDVDGDGVPDLALASQGGWARVVSGADGAVLREWLSPHPFGNTVGAAGDVDADGVPDVIVGAPDDVGFAVVYGGADGRLLHLLQPPPAEEDGVLFGASVAGAGDVDGDGFADLLVGAPLEAGGGVVRVYGGRDAAVLHAFAGDPGSGFGGAVAAAGDLDGDGYADVAVGARSAGAVAAYSGESGRTLLSLAGRQGGDDFGAALAGCGDADGDGVPDLLVGAPGAAAGAGGAYLVSGDGGGVLHAFGGEQPFDAFGVSVAGGADLDGDGLPDPIVGSARLGAGAIGYARAASGRVGGPLFTAHGETPLSGTDFFGWSVACLGDVDGDGHADLAVGAPFDDDGGPGAGRVTVLTSPPPFPTLPGGSPASSGTEPVLAATCTLHAGDLLTLVLHDAPPAALCFFVVGAQVLGAPFSGGVLVPYPEVLHLVATDADGRFVASVPWPDGAPPQLVLHVQAWVVDGGAGAYAGTDAVVVGG